MNYRNTRKDQEIIMIAAIARNNVIGIDGKLPWRIKEDMDHFIRLTTPHPVIMGRATYESISKNFRPLKNRQNVVLANNISFREDGVYVARSEEGLVSALEDALDFLGDRRSFVDGIDYSKIFIGGGQKVYEAAMPYATRLEITHVHRNVEGPEMRYFPEFRNDWKEVSSESTNRDFSFATYVRR